MPPRDLRFNHQQYWFNDSDENGITFSRSLSLSDSFS